MDVTMRIGHGYDVHRLAAGRKLIIGGVDIPYPKGLMGHSDADVLTHAVIDAILGALGAGDIGGLFPDSDAQYKDADSLKLLEICIAVMKEKGYTLGNLDTTVIAQKPKLSPYIAAIRERLTCVFDVPADKINIKAKTEEGLGFTGTGKGIAAHAVCLLYKI